jgi:hypothetical protein
MSMTLQESWKPTLGICAAEMIFVGYHAYMKPFRSSINIKEHIILLFFSFVLFGCIMVFYLASRNQTGEMDRYIVPAISVAITCIGGMVIVMLVVMVQTYQSSRENAEDHAALDYAALDQHPLCPHDVNGDHNKDNEINDGEPTNALLSVPQQQLVKCNQLKSSRSRAQTDMSWCRYLFQVVADPPTSVIFPHGVPRFRDYLQGKLGCAFIIVMIVVSTSLGVASKFIINW